MVALHKADGAVPFLITAPFHKFMMHAIFVTGQRKPQIKNITQEYEFLTAAVKKIKHFKKGCMISICFANVGVGNDDHMTCALCD